MTAWRLPFAVVTPGSMFTKSMALREVSGSCTICFVLIVWEIVVDCVCTISDDEETVTCSETPPTSIVAFTLAGDEDVSTTLLITTVLKPWIVTVTVYAPIGSEGSENTPSALVTALLTMPVPVCLAATSAPGITAPDASTTVPERV
jgi:hypothetical protein